MSKGPLSLLCATVCGAILNDRLPFPGDPMMQLIAYHSPWIYASMKHAWMAMLYSTPFIGFSLVFSWMYVHLPNGHKVTTGSLPAFPDPEHEEKLHVVLGETHHIKKAGPADEPGWLCLPDKGLYTGLIVCGGIGSGKTSAALRPYAWQVLSWQAQDEYKKVAGLVLEVKGDFCHQVRAMMRRCGRSEDYIELSMSGEYRYNPLHNDLDAFALAYSIASLLNQLYGAGKEPFWQQAYTNLVQFLILLHKTVDEYCNLLQVYYCAINPDRIREKIREGDNYFGSFADRVARISMNPLVLTMPAHDWLEGAATWVNEDGLVKAEHTPELAQRMLDAGIDFDVEEPEDVPTNLERRMDQFQACKTWFDNDWERMDSKLRTSIVEGISVFLAMFDASPDLKYTFCPPKELYDPQENADGRYGKPLPAMAGLLEQGKVLALNFPMAANPATSRMMACMMKMDFQRAVQNRISIMAEEPERNWRQIMFLCDEYHMLATSGGSDPNGDEKFFSLSRQALCIPIVATQSVSSLKSTLPGDTWQTLLQCFRTKIFLTQADPFTAKYASDLIGTEVQLVPSYSIAENGQDVRVQMLTGRAAAHKAGVNLSKTYGEQKKNVFEPSDFMKLDTMQAVVLAFDGSRQHATRLYLKPWFADRRLSYWEQKRKKLI